jgi:hypothetical protein
VTKTGLFPIPQRRGSALSFWISSPVCQEIETAYSICHYALGYLLDYVALVLSFVVKKKREMGKHNACPTLLTDELVECCCSETELNLLSRF